MDQDGTVIPPHYRIDPEFGWMHARIQTWFPFYVHVCINGREWLARRMDREGLRYVRQENCFPWVRDIPRAQQLLQEQLQVNWAEQTATAGATSEPAARGDLPQLPGAILLERLSVRVGDLGDF
jgi:hypothetical protein